MVSYIVIIQENNKLS